MAIGNSFQAFVIVHDSFHAFPDLALSSDTRASIRGLNFQLSTRLSQKTCSCAAFSGATPSPEPLHAASGAARPCFGRQQAAGLSCFCTKRRTTVFCFDALFDGENYVIREHALPTQRAPQCCVSAEIL